MADVADGRARADVRPSPPFREVQQRQAALGREPRPQGAPRPHGVAQPTPAGREFVAGGYSIADNANWALVSRYELQNIDPNEYPNVKRWYTAIAKRPGVQKGYKVPK